MGKFLEKYLQPGKGIKDYLFEPISKQLTGKSLGERADLLNKAGNAIADKAGMSGKPLSVTEAFIKQLPSAVGQALIQTADLSPADVALMAGTAGVARIPVAGTTVGAIAKTVPVGRGFVQGVKELGKTAQVVEQALPGAITPEPIVKEPPIRTPEQFAENINLTKFPEDVRGKVYEVITDKPSIGKTPKVSDEELFKMASELKGTPTINYLSNLKEGTVEAEALKLRQGNTQLIRDVLKQDLTQLKDGLDGLIEDGLTKQRKVASIFGRGLRQQKLPADEQQGMAFLIDDKITAIKRDPILGKDAELIGSLTKLRDTVVDKEFNPTMWNKVYSGWMNSILSNPMTHIVNTASNTLFTLAKIPEKFASAMWDLPISAVTGKRTQYFGEIPAMVKGLMSKEKLPVELMPGSKIEHFSQPIKGMAGKIIGTPGNLLQLEDNLAKNTIGRMELYAQRYAGKTGAELTEAVQNEQLYRTFQNEPNAIAKALMHVRDKVPGLRYVVPFLKTPANLIDRGLERTPLVLGKILYKGATKTYTQEELSKDLGLLSLGSTLAGWIAWQKVKGNITGNAPEKPADRDAFYRQGKKPNAIKVGEYWVPLDRLEPVGSAFSIIANLIQDYQNSDKDLSSEKVLDAVGGLAKTLTNKTYLSGMTNFIKATSDPEMYGASWLRRISSGAVPNALSFLAQIKDPYYREANSVLDYLKAKVPGLSETLPTKLNAFGEPVKRDVLNIGKEKPSQLETSIADTPIGFPSKMAGKVKMSPDTYHKVLMLSGGTIKKDIETLASNPEFRKLPQADREKIVADVVARARRDVKKKVLSNLVQPIKPSHAELEKFRVFGKSDFYKKYGTK
jgi:hypothetical protein